MRAVRLLTGALFLAGGFMTANAGAAELRVLSVEAMKPALQELAPAFEKESKDKLKIDYAAPDSVAKKVSSEEEYDVVILDKKAANKLYQEAKLAGGSMENLAKQGDDVYTASTTNWTEEPDPAKKLIDFLHSDKAAQVYKAKGLQPG